MKHHERKPYLVRIQPDIFSKAKSNIKDSDNIISDFIELCLLLMIAGQIQIPNKTKLRQEIQKIYFEQFFGKDAKK